MDTTPGLDRSDRIAMYAAAVMAASGAVIAITAAVERLREVAPGHDIPVTVPLDGETAPLPLGPDGAAVTATVETATVVVPDPAPATMFALWAEPIWAALAICAGLVIAVLFFLRLARGRAFTRGASRLAYTGAGVIAVGWVGDRLWSNMTTNGAMSAISDYTYGVAIFEASLVPLLAILVVGAIGAALHVGEKLQRETEGLV
ncbi:hypothetical protein [Demequina sp. SO4-18]|uniref:hypothetical protein n=1 Tax=Demequina sp. SO4-18 TaxID=3401026 RepID=UPI003B59A806